MPALSDKTALVTGAGRGIGQAIALRLAREGARVALVDLTRAALDDTLAQLAAAGATAHAMAGDVTSAADWQRVLAEAARMLGGPHIVVNNAGVGGPLRPLLDYPDEDFDQVMAVNARGVFLGIKYGARAMRETGGCIVNVASVSGLSGSRFIFAYTASKHAVIGMTKNAALELAPLRIRVNAVCPAPTATEMMFNLERVSGDPEATRSRISASIPLGRYGEPAEIAAAVAFLSSDESSFMTGHALVVDGGMLAS